MLTSVALLTLMSVLVLGYLTVAVDSHNWTDQKAEEKRLENAAESVISLAVNQIWSDFTALQAGGTITTWEFKEYMEKMGVPDLSTLSVDPNEALSFADPGPDSGVQEASAGMVGAAATASAPLQKAGPLAGPTAEKVSSELQQKSSSELELEEFSKKKARRELRKKHRRDLRSVVKLPKALSGKDAFNSVDVDQLDISRQDSLDQVRLTFEVTVSTGTDGENTRGTLTKTIQESFVIQASEWDGMEYALLANNINCILCHLDVDNAERVYNDEPFRYNTFDRVKMGSIDSIQFRDEPHSTVAGSLYLLGDGLHHDGTNLTNWADLGMQSAQFDGAGKLVEDAWGNLTRVDLSPADAVDPLPNENLYLKYGEVNGQIDGFMPESFPPPFPDNGGYDFDNGRVVTENAGNRVVDKSEFMATVSGSEGSVSGGTIGVVPSGDKVETQAALDQLRSKGNTDVLGSITDGTVVMHGTKENPILLNGDVAVDGDVVISGYVKGEGAIRASGNVYMPSDLKYLDGQNADGNRTFGTAADGSENALAIASGGNVMVGNIFHPRWGSGTDTDGYSSGSYNFIMDELGTFNRMEWMKTQPTLPGKEVKVQVGVKEWEETVYEKKKVPYNKTVNTYKWVKTGEQKKQAVYKWVTVGGGNGYDPPQKQKVFSHWKMVDVKKKVKTGTKTVVKYKWVKDGTPTIVKHSEPVYEWQTPQLVNPHYKGSNYIPRYYSFTDGSTIPILNKSGYLSENGEWIGPEHLDSWKSSELTYADPNDKSDRLLYNGDGSAKAVVSQLTATDGWLTDELLKGMLKAGVDGRSDGSTDLEVDAVLYSNNSIFGIIPGRNSPGVNGRMVLNGAVVAADVGLLAPKGFRLNYDPRARRMMQISSDTEITIRRVLWAPTN